MDCFSNIKDIKNKRFFHDAHIGNGSALWTSCHFTCSPTHRRNPCGPGTCAHWDPHLCPLAQTPVVVCRDSGPPVLCFASHWVWGPRVLGHTIHPAVTVGGPHGHSVCDGLHVFLVLIDPLFEIIRTFVAINSCTSLRSHIGTSSVPSPTTMGADLASAFFLWALNRHTHPARGPTFARYPCRISSFCCPIPSASRRGRWCSTQASLVTTHFFPAILWGAFCHTKEHHGSTVAQPLRLY